MNRDVPNPIMDRVAKVRSRLGQQLAPRTVDGVAWESFLTQYNQLHIDVQDELEDYQQCRGADLN